MDAWGHKSFKIVPGKTARHISSGLAMILFAGWVGGCSVPAPEYGFQPDGSYKLSAWDMKLDCARLAQTISRHENKMLALVRSEITAREATPVTLTSALAKMLSIDFFDSKSVKEIQQEQKIVKALNGAQKSKGCV